MSEAAIAQKLREASPYGVTVVDEWEQQLGMIFIYLSVGVGIAYVHELVMRPDLTPAQAREVGREIMNGIKHLCYTHDYSRLYTTVSRPSLAREMRKQGWRSAPEQPLTLAYDI